MSNLDLKLKNVNPLGSTSVAPAGVAVGLDKYTNKGSADCNTVAGISPLGGTPSSQNDPPILWKSSLRRWQYRLRDIMARGNNGRGFTTSDRLRKCGHVRIAPTVDLVKKGHNPSYYRGINTCGSVWICPRCSFKIQAARQLEVQQAVFGHTDAGGQVALCTLTVRHHKKNSLADSFDAVTAGWKSITKGRAWQEDKKVFKNPRYIRATESTYGKNGWHLHLHMIWLFDEKLTDIELAAFFARIQARWISGVSKTGMKAPLDRAQDFRMMTRGIKDLSNYLVKAISTPSDALGISQELTLGVVKYAKSGNVSPFQLLAMACDGDVEAIRLWQEWELTTKGRRQLTWARGLKSEYSVEEKTDDEISEISEEEDPTILYQFNPDEWKTISRIINGKLSILETADQKDSIEALENRILNLVYFGESGLPDDLRISTISQ